MVETLRAARAAQGGWVVSGFPRTSAHVVHLQEQGLLAATAVLAVAVPTPAEASEKGEASEEGEASSTAAGHQHYEDLAAAVREAGGTMAGFPAAAAAAADSSVSPSATTAAAAAHALASLEQQLRAPFLVPAVEAEHVIDEEVEASNPGYGETGRFCPVALRRDGILFPGLPGVAAQYRNAYYHFSNEEARAEFLENPLLYAPATSVLQPPPCRIIVVGPPGAGKTTQCRRLARRHRLIHVSFQDRISEIANMPDHKHFEAIKGHTDSPGENELPPEVAMDLVSALWREEPHRSMGWVRLAQPRSDLLPS